MNIPSMTRNNLQVLRAYDGGTVLQRNVKMNDAQSALFSNGAVPAGRCISLGSDGEGYLGVSGNRVPMWLFRSTDKPSSGMQGPPATTATEMTWADGSVNAVLAFVGLEGLEIATTEYNKNETFNFNDPLTARMSNNAAYSTDAARAANAGVVFKTGVVYGAHPVVGVVSDPPTGPNNYRRFDQPYLVFYTCWRPPVAGLILNTPVNVAAL